MKHYYVVQTDLNKIGVDVVGAWNAIDGTELDSGLVNCNRGKRFQWCTSDNKIKDWPLLSRVTKT